MRSFPLNFSTLYRALAPTGQLMKKRDSQEERSYQFMRSFPLNFSTIYRAIAPPGQLKKKRDSQKKRSNQFMTSFLINYSTPQLLNLSTSQPLNPSTPQPYPFILARNSSLLLVPFIRFWSSRMASSGFISVRYTRSRFIRCSTSLSSSRSSRRVEEATISMAG